VAEPRAPRHAVAISLAAQDAGVVFIDCAPAGQKLPEPEELLANPHVRRKTVFVANRQFGAFRCIIADATAIVARLVFWLTGVALPQALGARLAGLSGALCGEPADVFIAHSTETLLLAARAAKKFGAELVFDSMEFHSDMGDTQTSLEKRLIRTVETKWLPRCVLVLASSDQLADALAQLYRIRRPIALYNTSPMMKQLAPKEVGRFHLYWRNAVIGLGQRGLEDVLIALRQLPDDVILNLQGRLQADGGNALRSRIRELGISNRVVIHSPFAPHQAVAEAAKYTVGLCLERRACRNHELTVSNKIFDYLMAGLAVVSSDLPGLRGVIERSGGGLLFQPGSPDGLARQIRRLYEDRRLLSQISSNGRAFALAEGNRDVTMARFVEEFRAAMVVERQEPVLLAAISRALVRPAPPTG